MTVAFKVARVDVVYVACKQCGGVGDTTRKAGTKVYKTKCPAYGCQNGLIKTEHRTEVNLQDALKEMGLIK